MGIKKEHLIATMVPLAILCVGLYFSFFAIDDWAAKAFAKPQMATALVAVLEIVVFFTALCFLPPLSRLVDLVLSKK